MNFEIKRQNVLFHFFQFSRVPPLHEQDVQEIRRQLNGSIQGDSESLCRNSYQCYVDRHRAKQMISEAPSEAVKYTSIILVCYVIGMVLLLLHFMKQKHGQVSDKDGCQKFVFDDLPPYSSLQRNSKFEFSSW